MSQDSIVLRMVNYDTDDSFSVACHNMTLKEAVKAGVNTATRNHFWDESEIGIETKIDGKEVALDIEGNVIED